MRVCDLYKQVAQLGFESSLEDDDRFYYAANRALLQVSALRPAISACVIEHRPMENLLLGDTFEPIERAEDLCFAASGAKAFYFETDGVGKVVIEYHDGAEWKPCGHVDFDAGRQYRDFRGFIKKDGKFVTGDVRLRFTGDYLYCVKNVALYAHIYSDKVEDIPAFLPFVRYDIGAMATDFLSLASPPISQDEAHEKLNQGYDVEGERILMLPHATKGSFRVLYRRAPRAIGIERAPSDNTDVIDADEEICSLLPILVASYVWVEDEPSMAEYYLALYRERAMEIERRSKSAAPVSIRNINGW